MKNTSKTLAERLAKGVEVNSVTRLLTEQGAQKVKPDMPANTTDAARNRAGGGAAGKASAQKWADLLDQFKVRQDPQSEINCVNPLLAEILKGQLTVEQINADPDGAADVAAAFLMAKNDGKIDYRRWNGGSRNVPNGLDQLALHNGQQRVLKSQLQYDTGLDDVSDPVGVTQASRAESNRLRKSNERVPNDSYQSAGDLAQRVQKQEKQRAWHEPDINQELPWYLRRR